LRNRASGELILFGRAGHVAQRMTSLLPKPLGRGTRRNQAKREYVLEHIEDIEYRTLACTDKEEAKQVERELTAQERHLFNT
jgi:hypothetical protein